MDNNQNLNRRTLWFEDGVLKIIDQRKLPRCLEIESLSTVEEVYAAIKDMHVRGAPAIGATAAFGIYFAARQAQESTDFEADLEESARKLKSARPTAVNLSWAVERQLLRARQAGDKARKAQTLLEEARRIAEEDVENCRKIGQHGLELLRKHSLEKKGAALQIMTHCNAGFLACVEHGTATAPLYAAFSQGLKLHVWVSETRPRNQGAKLTAWELGQRGIPYTLIADNAAGFLMKKGQVDLVLVGADRVTRRGDVVNKVGTYLKALAARDNNIPFYAALPSSSIDWSARDALLDVAIEERDGDEVRYVEGAYGEASVKVLTCPPDAQVSNYAFDVTPAHLVSAIITERGICRAAEADLTRLYPAEHSL